MGITTFEAHAPLSIGSPQVASLQANVLYVDFIFSQACPWGN